MDLWQVLGVGLVVWVLLIALARGTSTRDQLGRIERKLDVLLAQNGLQEAWRPPVSERVLQCIASGRKIDAIKTYREENPQVSLREAKDMIEANMTGRQT